MTTYIIITDKSIHHEGDQRSRDFPGHGYAEYTETVQQSTEYDDYDKFIKKVNLLERDKQSYRAYSAERLTVTTTVTVNVTK